MILPDVLKVVKLKLGGNFENRRLAHFRSAPPAGNVSVRLRRSRLPQREEHGGGHCKEDQGKEVHIAS